MLKKISIFFFLGAIQILSAQNNINSPYSLFGLGIENQIATGGLVGMGNSGVAQRTYNEINLFNPANLGNIMPESFLQDFGLNGLYSVLKNNDTNQSTTKGNVSHLAFAFPVARGWGVSLGILPYTTTGYEIDVEGNVEGYPATYTTSYVGSGGLNKFFVSSGYKINKRLSVGVDFAVLFGTLIQETQIISSYIVDIYDQNHYNGLKLTTGVQYDVFQNDKNRTTLGATIELPTVLSGDQNRSSYKTTSLGGQIEIEENTATTLDDFELPLSIGVGVSSAFRKFTTNLDYKRVFWNNTDQKLNDGRYTDQSIYAFGLEYVQENKNASFFRLLKYRFGVNYNTGMLNVSNEQIESRFVSVGLGFPISRTGKDSFNFSYSYGTEGTVNHNLIQENYHKISINLSFNGSWFKKAKIL